MTQTAAPVSRHGDGYEHFAPLFVAYRALPAAHPLRSRLRKDLIAGYHPVALHIARKYAYRGENPDDLEQVATLGLILAVDRFEPDRGIDFLSFAVPTITGEVLRYFRDRSAPIRVPRRLRVLKGLIYEATAELSQRLGVPRVRARSPRRSTLTSSSSWRHLPRRARRTRCPSTSRFPTTTGPAATGEAVGGGAPAGRTPVSTSSSTASRSARC